ncbi:beta-lactamase domain protein [Candidatus Moduliflexus flocculans]|uniref:Beta-lactamase domain protein n=1 Tax=Candidatus Moduliflexus flocculans TaxID=1499966 RepID=A0A081BR53_9BACT|nr:beta-lactamase domain protein [Candidatus Moduliflexus flocculans]
MKLTFIGTGSAFTLNNYQSNMILTADDGDILLIDCGADARFALRDLGLTYKNIESVYISHLHSDHVGGLEWLGFTRKFDPSGRKPHMYISRYIKSELWSTVLSGGMLSLQGEVADLDTYFDVHSIGKNQGFTWKNVEFQLVQAVHIMSGFHIVPSFGLLFEINGMKTFLTTDTQFSPAQITEFYKRADLIFHDCETTPFHSNVHAHYDQLRTLPLDTKQKMWLYHYQDGVLPDAQADGFAGFVQRGQTFDFAHLEPFSPVKQTA